MPYNLLPLSSSLTWHSSASQSTLLSLFFSSLLFLPHPSILPPHNLLSYSSRPDILSPHYRLFHSPLPRFSLFSFPSILSFSTFLTPFFTSWLFFPLQSNFFYFSASWYSSASQFTSPLRLFRSLLSFFPALIPLLTPFLSSPIKHSHSLDPFLFPLFFFFVLSSVHYPLIICFSPDLHILQSLTYFFSLLAYSHSLDPLLPLSPFCPLSITPF